MGQSSSRCVIIERNNLEAGDHICTRGVAGYFYHHGIYVGEDKVIHLTKLNGWHGPVYSSLESFLNGCSELRHYEYTTDDAASDNAEVVRRAYSAVQFGFENMRLDRYDSKTFAMYCKTGKYISPDTPNYGRGGPMPNHFRHMHEFPRYEPYHFNDHLRHGRDNFDFHPRSHAFDFHTHRPMGPT